jgi:hypothetical protein
MFVFLMGWRFGFVGHLPAILHDKGLLLALKLYGVEKLLLSEN